MNATGALVTLSPRDFDAVLFDLDGVLTPTASVHAAAWKRLFDDLLRRRAETSGEPFVPFDIDADYRRYVDGKPRYDGVRAFLESRGIDLPEGRPDDAPGERSVQALGSLKDQYFLEQLRIYVSAASSPTSRRSPSYARCVRRTCVPPSCPRAAIAPWCSRPPASPRCSTCALTATTSHASG